MSFLWLGCWAAKTLVSLSLTVKMRLPGCREVEGLVQAGLLVWLVSCPQTEKDPEQSRTKAADLRVGRRVQISERTNCLGRSVLSANAPAIIWQQSSGYGVEEGVPCQGLSGSVMEGQGGLGSAELCRQLSPPDPASSSQMETLTLQHTST